MTFNAFCQHCGPRTVPRKKLCCTLSSLEMSSERVHSPVKCTIAGSSAEDVFPTCGSAILEKEEHSELH